MQPVQHEMYRRMASFDPSITNPAVGGLPGGIRFEGSGPGRCNCTFASAYPYALGPRIGVAWQVLPKTVLRIGWAISYSRGAAQITTFGLLPRFRFQYPRLEQPRRGQAGIPAQRRHPLPVGRPLCEQSESGPSAIGNGYASFLLGYANNGTMGAHGRRGIPANVWAFFAQDTWKTTRKLTVDYGLRYDKKIRGQTNGGEARASPRGSMNSGRDAAPGGTGTQWSTHINGSSRFHQGSAARRGSVSTYLAGHFGESYDPMEGVQEFKVQTSD